MTSYFFSPVSNVISNKGTVSYNINRLNDVLVTVETENSDHCVNNDSDENPTFMINIIGTSNYSDSSSYIVQVPVNSTVITENDRDFIINRVMDYLVKEVCKKYRSHKRSYDPSWKNNI